MVARILNGKLKGSTFVSNTH